jgi:hypothetical protein
VTDFRAGLPPEISTVPDAPGTKRRMAIGLAVVVVLIAGTFALVNLAGADENSPTDPVREMIEAAEARDIIGILEQIDPGERDAVRGPLEDMVDELNRLDVFEDASLEEFTGYELEVEDLELEATEVRDGLQAVRITSGTSTQRFNADDLPLGGFVRDLTDDLDNPSEGTSELAEEDDDEAPIVVVERGGRWYVSFGYSIAEGARRADGRSIEELGDGVEPDGADSAEDAVREFMLAAADLDPRRLIELLPPDELGAVQDYAGMFIEEAEGLGAFARRAVKLDISTLELDADTDGDHALVKVEELEFTAKGDGFAVSFRDGCFSYEVPGMEPDEVCKGDEPTEALPFGDLELPDFSFVEKRLDVGFVATRVDGKWFVSPVRTVLENFVAALRLVEPGDLDKGVDWFEELQGTFGQMLGEALLGGESMEMFDSDAGYEGEGSSGVCATFDGEGPPATYFAGPEGCDPPPE